MGAGQGISSLAALGRAIGSGHVGRRESVVGECSASSGFCDTTDVDGVGREDGFEVGIGSVTLGVVGVRGFGTVTEPDGVVSG